MYMRNDALAVPTAPRTAGIGVERGRAGQAGDAPHSGTFGTHVQAASQPSSALLLLEASAGRSNIRRSGAGVTAS